MVKTTPKKVHDATLTIRVKRELIDRAREEAHRQGMSLSEAVRQYLRELAEETSEDAEETSEALEHPAIELARLIFESPSKIRMDRTEEEERRLEQLLKQLHETRGIDK